MPRSPLPLGAHGKISTVHLGPAYWEARARHRDYSGRVGRPSGSGPTEAAAITALQQRIADLNKASARGTLPSTARFAEVAAIWFESDLEPDVAAGALEETTLDVYRSVWKRWVQPRLGALVTSTEINGAVVDELLRDVRAKRGVALANTVKTVISGICIVAERHKLMDHNPTRTVKRLRRTKTERIKPKAIPLDEIPGMHRRLISYGQAKATNGAGHAVGPRARVWLDLADLAMAMLATGARLGEALAWTPEDITRHETQVKVLIDAHVVRVTGKGLLRRPGRKGDRPAVEPIAPAWAAAMFRRRVLAAPPGKPIFGTADHGWLDPSNTTKRVREALDAAGMPEVTSHTWRKTVASILYAAGCSVEEIAAVLGNTVDVVERHYIEKSRSSPKATAALAAALAESFGNAAGNRTEAG
jgi:integrase